MCVRRWLAASRTPLLTDRGRPPSRITVFCGAERCFCEKFHFRVMFLWEFGASPWGSCRFRPTFARSCVCAWCFSANSMFPHGEVAGFGGPSWDANPARLRETTRFMLGQKSCRPDLAIYILIYHTNADPRSMCTRKLAVFCKAPLKHGLTLVI